MNTQVDPTTGNESAFNGRAVAAGIGAIVMAHCGLVFMIYGARDRQWSIAQSDFVLLTLPFLLAWAATAVLLFRSRFLAGVTSVRGMIAGAVAILLISIVVAFVSAMLSLLVPINVYGT